jgi:hypothetical protein
VSVFTKICMFRGAVSLCVFGKCLDNECSAGRAVARTTTKREDFHRGVEILALPVGSQKDFHRHSTVSK